MQGFVDYRTGEFYLGDQAHHLDFVVERPSADHRYNLEINEWELDTELLKRRLREQREPLFAEMEVKINDYLFEGLSLAPLAVYRQSLKDITDQPDLQNPVWPIKPWEQE